ncbi:MAG: hypothetical protein ACYDAG_16420 [Chloroflexota bacterium]
MRGPERWRWGGPRGEADRLAAWWWEWFGELGGELRRWWMGTAGQAVAARSGATVDAR